MVIENALYASDNYKITVADGSRFNPEYKDCACYRITNLNTDVVEGESFSLPRAILQAKVCDMILLRIQQDDLDEYQLAEAEHMLDVAESGTDVIRRILTCTMLKKYSLSH